LGEGPHGSGIRDFPYTTDLGVNPQTLASIDCPTTQQPHCVGQVWAAALWEVYWSLVGAHGFDPDLYGGSGGNNLALQLVMDGLKLQECHPTFLSARDAILEADQVNNGGANQCLIWQAFARRGMGVDADDRGNPRFTRNMTDDFTVPEGCAAACGNGTVEPGEQCDDGGTADGDCCSSTCQFESAATECRASAGDCDLAESCPGDAGTCPADAFEADTTLCRAAADLCDAAEFCPGDGAQCPGDAFQPDTFECRSAAGVCDLPELCTGLGSACPADAKSTSLCRGIGGTCDVAESCDGVSDQCPPDQVDPGLCADSNPCTTEACVVLDCQFTDVSDGTLCADADLCNGDETCQAGVCSAGAPLDCDDGDVCTADGCDAVSGCLHDPIPECVSGSCGDGALQPELGEECDDGNQEGGDGCAADCLLEPVLVPALEGPALWALAALLLALGLAAQRGRVRPDRA
jgi:cysteine-rich repeat protein